MITIRDNFINKVTISTTNAIGAYSILQSGINAHGPVAIQYPNAVNIVGSGAPTTPGVRAVKYSPTHAQAQSYLSNNRQIILELYLTQIVQEWFDFLADIYEKAIDENLNNNGNYTIPLVRLRLDLSPSSGILEQQVFDSATKDFDFLTAKDKLKTIERVLNSNLSNITNEKQLLTVNIKVRNILQHSSGIVAPSDLTEIGLSAIDEDHGNRTVSITAGQKVTRTAFDIENLTDALILIANTLIP